MVLLGQEVLLTFYAYCFTDLFWGTGCQCVSGAFIESRTQNISVSVWLIIDETDRDGS